MLNKIIQFSLNNRLLVLLITCFLLIGGSYIAYHADIDVFPDLNAPTVVVMTEAPGYAAEEIEKNVTFPIETILNGATNVRRVRSSSNTGFSSIWVEFDWGTDIYKARQIVTEKLASLQDVLPKDVKTPVLGPQSSILGEVLIIGLTADSTSMQNLRTIADKNLRPRLLALGGVSEVQVIGGDIKEYQILLDLSKMKYYNVTLQQASEALRNINSNVGGGILYEYGNEYIIKGDINTRNLNEIAASVVKSDGTAIVTLNDIAKISIGSKSPKLGLASEKAKPAVLLTLTKQPSTDTKQLTENVLKELDYFSPTIPKDVKISTDTFRQSDFIDNSISNIKNSLIEGALFVIIVLSLFLMNWRTTFISLLALPLSILMTIVILHFMGYTLNTMSLGGIAIAIGSLVDDAIVDVENVYKRLRENRAHPKTQQLPILKVVYDASTEVRMPIFNSSLIIIASFMPLFFLTGLEGRLLIPLGISFIVALIASTIIALTVTPVLCSYLLGQRASKEDNESLVMRKLKNCYERLLEKSFCHKKLILSLTAALFVCALGLFFMLGRSFLPPFNEGSFTINVSLMPGVSLDESNKIGQEAEKIILSIPEISTVSRKTGRAELAEHSFGVNVSEIEAPYVIKNRSKSEILKELRTKLAVIPGANIEIGQPISHRIDAMLSGSKAQIAIKLFGSDLNALYSNANLIKTAISKVEGIVDINIEQQVSRPQLHISPKRGMLAKYGISIEQFSECIRILLSGDIVSQVYDDGFPYDLTVKVSDNDRNSIDKIGNLLIDSPVGKIPLSNVAEIKSVDGPNTINRENASRRIIISANVEDRDLRGAVNDIKSKISSEVELPKGYYLQYSGQFENEESASRTLAIASGAALLVIFMLLYQEFKNGIQSLVILLNLPLAMIGGVFILFFSSKGLNIPAIIGFIALLGITTRNGMLLMSNYNRLKQEGISLKERIYSGSADRLTPIIMTALTSALALIPLALKGNEPGNEIQSPMAIVILGGLFSATILNLFVLPMIYYYINRKNEENN